MDSLGADILPAKDAGKGYALAWHHSGIMLHIACGWLVYSFCITAHYFLIENLSKRFMHRLNGYWIIQILMQSLLFIVLTICRSGV